MSDEQNNPSKYENHTDTTPTVESSSIPLKNASETTEQPLSYDISFEEVESEQEDTTVNTYADYLSHASDNFLITQEEYNKEYDDTFTDTEQYTEATLPPVIDNFIKQNDADGYPVLSIVSEGKIVGYKSLTAKDVIQLHKWLGKYIKDPDPLYKRLLHKYLIAWHKHKIYTSILTIFSMPIIGTILYLIVQSIIHSF